MAEDLCSAFDAINSPDDETRTSAHNYIDQQTKENPDLYPVLFEIYNNSTSNIHKKLSLIALKLVVCYNFDVVSENLEIFSQLLGNSIEGSEDQSFYQFQVEILLQILFRLRNVWNDLPTYLTLFQTHDNLIPFCVYLFYQCSRDQNIHQKYKDVFEELSHDIILRGLQFPGIDIQLYSTICFLKFVSKHKNNIPEEYEVHYNIICEIAKNSADLAEDKFNIFWSQFYRLNPKYLDPFFEIAKEFLNEGKDLSPTSQLKLLNILILSFFKLVPDDLEYIINTYFNLQSCIEGIDFNDKIFENLSKVDLSKSYELLKSNLLTFITNDDQYIQYKGLSMLDSFVRVYMSPITGDISVFLEASLQIAANSPDNFNLMSKFILSYLEFNKFNYEDTNKIYNMISQCFVNKIYADVQFLACQISTKMGPNPCFFDSFLEIFDQIQFESLPIYFSLLLNLHSVENNMSDQKYEKFYEFLFEQFRVSYEKVDEVYQSFLDQESNEKFEELYSWVLLRNSSSNLIYLFSVYNPARFAEFFEQTIQCFADLIQKEELREENSAPFSIVEIENDFTRVFKIDYERSIGVLKNFYEVISEGQDIEELQHFLIDLDNSEYDNKKEFIEYYQDFRDGITFPHKLDKDDIIYNINVIVKPVCKWIYKLNEEEIQFLNQPSSSYVSYYRESRKPVFPIHGVILTLLKLTKSSYELLINLIQLIKIIVNPKRLNYNQENAWYINMCQKLVAFLQQVFATKVLGNMYPSSYCSSFKALSDLMKVFIYTNCDFGHDFLTNVILPFYENYQESSEIGLLDLFSKMIDSNYINQTEMDAMIQVISCIINREESLYLDSRPSLVLLITKLSKLNNEVAPNFIEFVLQTFNNVKEDPFLLDVKISCSYFLLSSFNQDNEQFKCVIPLLPDIISVFPCRKLINEFFVEMKTFIENNAENFEKDLYEMLIFALMRYLSYQNNASNIFKFDQSSAEYLVEIFGKLFETYCQNCQVEDPDKLIFEFLSDQPIAAQYILSLKQ